ncbi:MAG TPA: glycosyltransferase [Longimicrobiales bacterium]|nr:glycosyltransferase [Longimicrobiales bacterium]
MDAAFIGIAAACFWALALLARGGAVLVAFLHPAVARRRAGRGDRPPLSVIVPVAQEEPEADAAFASLFDQAYPGFEVLVTSAHEDSEAIGTARRAALRFPHVPTRFLTGNQRHTLNPKVSNIEPAVAAAAHELILVKDSNVTLPPGHLTEMVRSLRPGVGMVCTLPVGLHPRSFAAEIECAMTNAYAAPWLLGGSFIGMNIGFGKVMLFDRREFRRAGGLDVMSSTFGDDHALAKSLGRLGLRTVFSGGVVHRVMGRRTLREVWDRQLRWILIRRRESLLAFLAEPLSCAGTATLAGALAAPVLGVPGWAAASATAVAWLAGDVIVVAGRGWGLSWRFPMAVVCREAMVYALWLRTWSTRTVSWAGERFDVGPSPRKAG